MSPAIGPGPRRGRRVRPGRRTGRRRVYSGPASRNREPSADGSLFLDAGPEYTRRRPVRLPGLTLLPRRGPGPMAGDMPHLEGLHFSSRPRAFLDNMRGSRARDGVSRTLATAEIEDELTRIAATRGRSALGELLDQAREMAETLNAAREMATLEDLIGAILGTRNVELATPAARAAHAEIGFDPRRIELFEALHAALMREPLESRSDRPGSLPTLPFIEAYFSNWIEGTEFELREAEKIVFKRAVPDDRLEDAHDVLEAVVRHRTLEDNLLGLSQLELGPLDPV